MADTVTTPPASPTDTIIPAATLGHDNAGMKIPQPANKPKTAPTVQKSNPAPKPRQEYPSRKGGKPDQQFRSQPDGNSRRKQFQPSTRAPAFVVFPVVIHDFCGGSARLDKLGPYGTAASCCAKRWQQNAPLGRFHPGSGSLDAPLRPSRASWHAWTSCPGGSPIGARIPRPMVEGVVGPILWVATS